MYHDTYEKFTGRTIGLHWLIAVGIVIVLALGVYMHELEDGPFKFQLYALHKSLGVLIFPFALYRIFWRVRNGFPLPVGKYSNAEHVAAKVVHYVLILGTVLMPISGMIFSGTSGHGVAVFGLELVPTNYVEGKAVAFSAAATQIGRKLHEIGGNLLLLGIALHIAGALKHHIIDKDGTLRRMLGARL